uniref:Transmembrane protein n=1 Tax=Haemonchus contortus TaxID=6289 RepID=A0A7I4Y0A1_HAECO
MGPLPRTMIHEATTTRQTTATATSTTSIKVPTTFATTSDFEFPGRSTTLPGTSAYDDQGFIPDKESFSTSKTEAGEPQLMDSFLGQYGLAIPAAFAISLIVIIAIIAVMLRKGKRNKHVGGAVGKGGKRKVKGSKETSNEGSRESKTKEGGSKEKMTLSKE